MKIILIGKNGQLGHALELRLQKTNNETFSFGSADLDILDFESVEKIVSKIKPDVIINTAAYHVVADCETFPDRAFAVNVVAEKNLAQLCNKRGIRLIYYSTDRVFDGEKRKPYRESDAPNPIQMYGISKLAGEFATLNYNPNSLVIRTCGLFGGVEGSREKKGNFVLYILKMAKEVSSLEIASNQMASFAYADDLAEATYLLLKKKTNSGIYHVANEKYDSWANFAQKIVKIRNLKLVIKPVNRSKSYNNTPTPEFTALSTAKIKSQGIVMPHWRNGLKRYLEFLELNGI